MQKLAVEKSAVGSVPPSAGLTPVPTHPRLSVASGPKRTPGDYLKAVTALPPIPTLVTELLAAFQNPDKDVDQVVNLITYEPAVTAELLKRCNSVFFSGQEPTVDIFEAVSRVGFYEIYCLVASMFGAKLKNLPGAGAALDVEAVWRHSVSVALAAAAIADQVGESRPLAFTTGLLHDVGRLVFGSAERERYAKLVQALPPYENELVGAEQALFGTDHAELGAELMARWKLPEEVAQAVRYHHDLNAAQGCLRAAALLQLADLIGYAFGPPDPESPEWMGIATPALQVLGLGAAEVQRLTEQTEQGLQKVQGLLGV